MTGTTPLASGDITASLVQYAESAHVSTDAMLDSSLFGQTTAFANNTQIMKKYLAYAIRRLLTALGKIRYRNAPEKIVAMGYDEMAADYGSWTLRHERPDREKYTNLLMKNLPEGAELLELGCGPGDPTTKTLAQRYKVTANDISESCLALARQNVPGATFIRSDMTSLDFPADSFNAVVAFYAFHHVPRDRYLPLLENIVKWLKPGGIFMAAMYPYDIENLVTEDWHGSSMYWSSFDEEKTIELIETAGLKILERTKESAIEAGKETTFLWILAARA